MAITQETPAAFMASGACSLEEPQPKFTPATIMSPSYVIYKFLVYILHTMSRKVLRVGGVEISCRNYDVRIHMVAVIMNFALYLHINRSFLT